MPTSYMRSGNRSANADSPVGPGMAAVMATTSSWSSPTAHSSSAKIFVQEVPDDAGAFPVSGSILPMPCMWSAWSFSAGA